MPELEMSLFDIADVRLQSLNGTIETWRRPRKIRLTTAFSLTIDDELSEVLVDVDIKVHGTDDPESDEGELIYSGSAAHLVTFNPDVQVTDDQDFGESVLDAVWPYVRAALVDHAKRVGGPPIHLPIAPHFPPQS